MKKPKFKVGDRVKIINPCSSNYGLIGLIVRGNKNIFGRRLFGVKVEEEHWEDELRKVK